MSVVEITSTSQFDQLRKKPRFIAEFTSGYCKPCGWVDPTYGRLSRQYKDIVFVVVDGDKQRDLISRYAVNGLPTFILFKRGRKVDEFVGIVEETLVDRVDKFAAS